MFPNLQVLTTYCVCLELTRNNTGAAPANKAVSAARVTGVELCPLRDTKMPPISAAPVAMTTFSQRNLRQV